MFVNKYFSIGSLLKTHCSSGQSWANICIVCVVLQFLVCNIYLRNPVLAFSVCHAIIIEERVPLSQAMRDRVGRTGPETLYPVQNCTPNSLVTDNLLRGEHTRKMRSLIFIDK